MRLMIPSILFAFLTASLYVSATIETYKIVSGKYQPDVATTLYKSSVHVTRENDMRLEKSRVKYDHCTWWRPLANEI